MSIRNGSAPEVNGGHLCHWQERKALINMDPEAGGFPAYRTDGHLRAKPQVLTCRSRSDLFVSDAYVRYVPAFWRLRVRL